MARYIHRDDIVEKMIAHGCELELENEQYLICISPKRSRFIIRLDGSRRCTEIAFRHTYAKAIDEERQDFFEGDGEDT